MISLEGRTTTKWSFSLFFSPTKCWVIVGPTIGGNRRKKQINLNLELSRRRPYQPNKTIEDRGPPDAWSHWSLSPGPIDAARVPRSATPNFYLFIARGTCVSMESPAQHHRNRFQVLRGIYEEKYSEFLERSRFPKPVSPTGWSRATRTLEPSR